MGYAYRCRGSGNESGSVSSVWKSPGAVKNLRFGFRSRVSGFAGGLADKSVDAAAKVVHAAVDAASTVGHVAVNHAPQIVDTLEKLAHALGQIIGYIVKPGGRRR